jgi:hypothetical protein
MVCAGLSLLAVFDYCFHLAYICQGKDKTHFAINGPAFSPVKEKTKKKAITAMIIILSFAEMFFGGFLAMLNKEGINGGLVRQ